MDGTIAKGYYGGCSRRNHYPAASRLFQHTLVPRQALSALPIIQEPMRNFSNVGGEQGRPKDQIRDTYDSSLRIDFAFGDYRIDGHAWISDRIFRA